MSRHSLSFLLDLLTPRNPPRLYGGSASCISFIHSRLLAFANTTFTLHHLLTLLGAHSVSRRQREQAMTKRRKDLKQREEWIHQHTCAIVYGT